LRGLQDGSGIRLVRYAIMYATMVFIAIPIVYVALSSIKTNEEINRIVFFPSGLRLDNYIHVSESKTVWFGFTNSLLVTVLALLLAILVGALAGFAISRRRERIYYWLYLFFLSAMMIPIATNLTSLYVMIKQLGLIDSLFGLVLIYAANAIPMGVLLYSGFVKTIPREIEEAATIDGTGYYGRFIRIIIPLLKPVIITHAVISSVGIWNDFLMPLLFIRSPDKKTLPLAIYSFMSERATDWGAIFALLTVAMIPPILFFLLMQKHFYSGMTAGAVKG